MIDTGLIRERYDTETLKALGEAFYLIHSLGVFELQVKANTWALTEGFQERTPEDLAQEILQVQQTNRQLLALHEWAGNLRREINNA
jgi:hypothetical protein